MAIAWIMTIYTLNFNYLSYKSTRNSLIHKITGKINLSDETCPLVTIQLPIYNEKYVATRLINAVCSMDYPKERMEIQVLDDSDDETCDIIEALVDKYGKDGFATIYFPIDDFKTPPIFHDINEYLLYKNGVINFIKSRNRKIENYVLAAALQPSQP